MRDFRQIDPHQTILANFKTLIIEKAARISDEALDAKYGYGLSTDINSFGYKANLKSAEYALLIIIENETKGLPFEALVEKTAQAVHDGWSWTVYNVDDPRYLTQPEKKTNRHALADTPYLELSENEKEKDRVISRAIIAFYQKL